MSGDQRSVSVKRWSRRGAAWSEMRYRVGCAGMFELGMDYGVNDELGALAAALAGPVGCEVLDTQTGEWIGPYCQEDADEIRKRIDRAALPSEEGS